MNTKMQIEEKYICILLCCPNKQLLSSRVDDPTLRGQPALIIPQATQDTTQGHKPEGLSIQIGSDSTGGRAVALTGANISSFGESPVVVLVGAVR